MFKIDKGIDPENAWGKYAAYNFPFSDMQIGDSFFVPESYGNHSIISATAARFGRANRMKFVLHTVVETGARGYRCWRIA